ncbi:MAG: pyruvate, phosphate dikinase [Oscillospiraceae bacterium]|nr:pyruvate, phosphate dikinase [Oscillospiraceae bacterium]
MAHKYVYLFSEGNGSMRELLGGKGANLAEMTSLGMPVPQGFTITTEACTNYYATDRQISPEIQEQIFTYLEKLEEITGKKFGDPKNPLLCSVRSGARASMPGMMDTVLNLGLNDEVVEGLAELTSNRRFAYDAYRRFIQMFSDVVMGISKEYFDHALDAIKEARGIQFDHQLSVDDLVKAVADFKAVYKREIGEDFPTDSRAQLLAAVKAVFSSWENPRAIYYRRMNDIPSSWGTAVTVQSMVFGNMGDDCGTGVAFTRNPSTGENKLYGEFLMNAQGEDVVAGIRTPQTIDQLAQVMPDAYNQILEIAKTLEKHNQDMQDLEFTIEKGKLYMLQTRNGKRTAQAAIKIAVDMVDQGLCSIEEALMKVEPNQLDSLLHPQFEPTSLKNAKPVAHGLPASPGAACGRVYFNAEDAKEAAGKRNEAVILVRVETSPEDIEGMAVAKGVLTARGGMTSHAAVVARGMGRCCVSGCHTLRVDNDNKVAYFGDLRVDEGDYISIDGSTGNVYAEMIHTVDATLSGDFARFMEWADQVRTLNVRTNADTPKDARQARLFGAEGIGLCRTEHMFFEKDRILAMRQMILSKSTAERVAALDKILPMQQMDFEGLYREMAGLPVTIRFLDPPLHEFLPHGDDETSTTAYEMGMSFTELKVAVRRLQETNPMLGHRGCRLAISYPEIARMQTRAVMQAAINVAREGIHVEPEIMIPLVCDAAELNFVKNIVDDEARKVFAEQGMDLRYKVGAMIEIPRAALMTDEISKHAEFFSFGTNDLTQTTYGLSRDDASQILDDYFKNRIFEYDPTTKLDQTGVGKLIRMAAGWAKETRPEIKLGVCGEHGGDPVSIQFFQSAGLNYVSCSPYRVPIARLAAAQAKINQDKAKA